MIEIHEEIDKILAALVNNVPSNNPTQKAILAKYEEYDKSINCIDKIAFSSKRKWSGATFEELGTWILGAPEIILNKEYHLIEDLVKEEAKKGKRVLLLANLHNKLNDKLDGKIESVALILIEDIIREAAPEVLKYFNQQGVDVKIISGDSPVTVSEVARSAGVKNWENYVDARELPEDDEKLKELINRDICFWKSYSTSKEEDCFSTSRNGPYSCNDR